MKMLLIVFLIAANGAYACMCRFISDEEAYEQSSHVLLVKITEIEIIKPEENIIAKDKHVGKFEFIKSYKGENDFVENVYSFVGNSCSRYFSIGELFIIYSNNEKSVKLYTCSASRALRSDKLKAVLEKIEKLQMLNQ